MYLTTILLEFRACLCRTASLGRPLPGQTFLSFCLAYSISYKCHLWHRPSIFQILTLSSVRVEVAALLELRVAEVRHGAAATPAVGCVSGEGRDTSENHLRNSASNRGHRRNHESGAIFVKHQPPPTLSDYCIPGMLRGPTGGGALVNLTAKK